LALPSQSNVELEDLQIAARIGTYGLDDVVLDAYLLDLTLTIAPEPKCDKRPCCMDHVRRGTRPTRDGIQAVRSKLGRPSSVIRLSMRTPILASVF
jgi:hypothetical protein